MCVCESVMDGWTYICGLAICFASMAVGNVYSVGL